MGILNRRKRPKEPPKQVKHILHRRKIKTTLIQCQYCNQWQKAETHGYLDQEENDVNPKRQRQSEGTRKCLISHKEISSRSLACEDFGLHLGFWCRQHGQCQDIRACLSRRQKRPGEYGFREGCANCKQGTLIFNFIKTNRNLIT